MSDSVYISVQEFGALMSLTGLCHAEIATLISQRYWWREGHLHFLHLKDYSSLFGLDLTPNSHFKWKSLGNLPFIWKLSICNVDQLGADTIEALLAHPNLKEILFDSCTFLPETCAAFPAVNTSITSISFQSCAMPAFPRWVANIGSLKGLDFNPELFTEEFIDPDSPPRSFSSLPNLSHLTSLCSLALGSCGIGFICLAHLPPSLQFLDLQDNKISEFAPKIGELPRLWELNLSRNPLSTLDLAHLPELMQFRGAKTNLSSFPKELYGQLQLHLLDLSENSVPLDDVDWGQFPALGTLNLSQTGLAEFAPAFYNFSNVILAENSLSSLPPDLLSAKIQEIDLSKNHFSFFPEILNDLPGLKSIAFSDNPLTSLANIPPPLYPHLFSGYGELAEPEHTGADISPLPPPIRLWIARGNYELIETYYALTVADLLVKHRAHLTISVLEQLWIFHTLPQPEILWWGEKLRPHQPIIPGLFTGHKSKNKKWKDLCI